MIVLITMRNNIEVTIFSRKTIVGAIYTEFENKNRKTSEWHYYISSKKLSAEELLSYARKEWSVESMHWLLDVHFSEDLCRVENKNVQKNLNILENQL